MHIKFKRPTFVGGRLYDPGLVWDIPVEAFPVVKGKPQFPEDSIEMPEAVPVESESTTPKQAPGTKDDKGVMIGRQGFEAKGAEPQYNEGVSPIEGKPLRPVQLDIEDKLGDDLPPPVEPAPYKPPVVSGKGKPRIDLDKI